MATRTSEAPSGSFEAASPGQKGFLYKLKGFQRRTKTAFLKAATGSVEATHDVEYDGRHHDFTEMDKRTQNLRKRIDEFLKAQQRFCEAEEALSQALFDLYEEDNPQNGQVAAPLRDVSAGLYDLQIQVTQDLLPGLVAQWQSAVMGPVDRFQGRMSAINQDHERRSRYMADYDYYRSKDKRISDDTNIPEAKKEECKEKLANAQERFTAANNTLMSRMSAATQHKDALADETLLSTVALLRAMHEQSASRLAALDQLSDTEVARQAARKSKELLDKFEVETQLELQERSADVVSAFPPAAPSVRRDMSSMSPLPSALARGGVPRVGAGASAAPHARNVGSPPNGSSPPDRRATLAAHAEGNGTPWEGRREKGWRDGGLASVSSPREHGEAPTTLVRALFEYQGTTETELDLRENDVVTVLKQDRSGWWQGEIDGRIGWFPFNYVQVLS